MDDATREKAKDLLRKRIRDLMAKRTNDARQKSNNLRKRPATDNDGNSPKKKLWDNLSDSEEEEEEEEPSTQRPTISDARVDDALSAFWDEPRISRELCPLSYWKENSREHPEVFQIACETCSCPSGSVDSERLFSTAGNVISVRRTRLLPANAQDQIFLSKNLVFFQYDY